VVKSGKPDPVRGIEIASAHGWLDPDDDMAGALIELLAHVLAGGSINARFVPAISVGRRVDHDTIVSVFEAVGVDAQQRHTQTATDAREVYPTTDASVLGRCLVAMGAHRVHKTDLDALPAVVGESPKPIRRRFVRATSHTAGSTSKRKQRRVSRRNARRRISPISTT